MGKHLKKRCQAFPLAKKRFARARTEHNKGFTVQHWMVLEASKILRPVLRDADTCDVSIPNNVVPVARPAAEGLAVPYYLSAERPEGSWIFVKQAESRRGDICPGKRIL